MPHEHDKTLRNTNAENQDAIARINEGRANARAGLPPLHHDAAYIKGYLSQNQPRPFEEENGVLLQEVDIHIEGCADRRTYVNRVLRLQRMVDSKLNMVSYRFVDPLSIWCSDTVLVPYTVMPSPMDFANKTRDLGAENAVKISTYLYPDRNLLRFYDDDFDHVLFVDLAKASLAVDVTVTRNRGPVRVAHGLPYERRHP